MKTLLKIFAGLSLLLILAGLGVGVWLHFAGSGHLLAGGPHLFVAPKCVVGALGVVIGVVAAAVAGSALAALAALALAGLILLALATPLLLPLVVPLSIICVCVLMVRHENRRPTV